MIRALLGCTAAAALGVGLATQIPPSAVITGSAWVVDGDSLRVAGHRVRLAFIDSPELAQTCEAPFGTYPCGQDAKRALVGLIAGRDVLCEVVDTDKYHRSVATCAAGSTDLNKELLLRGWAVSYRQYDKDCRYCAYEEVAKRAKIGVWAGRFEWPWDWRKSHGR